MFAARCVYICIYYSFSHFFANDFHYSLLLFHFQAISSFEKMGKNLERIEEAIDFVNNRLLEEDFKDFSVPMEKKSAYKDSVKAPSEQWPAAAGTSILLETNPTSDPKLNSLSDQNEAKIPSELIAHCVAALLMIQVNRRSG